MAIKNFWSLEPGETIFAEELTKRHKDKIDIYFPLKDTGIDLLAATRNKRKIITFQIKESRYYEDKHGGTAWHQINKKSFNRNKGVVDFYIFLIYLPGYLTGTKKKNKFEKYFIILPTDALSKKIKFKKANKNHKYNFYFHIDNDKKNKVTEIREKKGIIEKHPEAFNYSKYFDAWGLIKKVF